jgi:hypothetical protein
MPFNDGVDSYVAARNSSPTDVRFALSLTIVRDVATRAKFKFCKLGKSRSNFKGRSGLLFHFSYRIFYYRGRFFKGLLRFSIQSKL